MNDMIHKQLETCDELMKLGKLIALDPLNSSDAKQSMSNDYRQASLKLIKLKSLNREIFIETIKELYESGEDVTIDDIITLYEGIGNANNELDSNSASKAETHMTSGSLKGDLVDALHKKLNNGPKSSQEPSKIKNFKEPVEDEDGDSDDMDDYAKKLNAKAKANVAGKKEVKSREDGNSLKESLDKIFEGEDFTEDFKVKAQVIFESYHNMKLQEHYEQLDEAVAEILEEEFTKISENLEEQLDKYLDYVVEEFLQKNAIAIESGIKVELAESLFSSFKNVLAENNIEIPEDKEDIIEDVIKENEDLKESYNKEVEKNIELLETLKELKKESLISEITEGLSDVESYKLSKLFEGIEYTDDDSFLKKTSILVEAYTDKTPKKSKILTEDYESEETFESKDVSDDVARVVKSLDFITRK